MKSSFVSLLQGWYYLLTGLWPVVHITSFMMISGYKTDQWLVKTMGVLLTAIGLTQIIGGVRKNISLELFVLSVSSAFVLTLIDVIYVGNGTILPVYLLDAVAEVVLIILWFLSYFRKNGKQVI